MSLSMQVKKYASIPLDREGNELVDMDDNPVLLNANGTISLYHRTTAENALKIKQTGRFISKENMDETYFSTKIDGQAEGYGDTIIKVSINPRLVRLDDAFHGGEISVAVLNKFLVGKKIEIL